MHTLKVFLGALLVLLWVPVLHGQAVVNPRSGSLEVAWTDLLVPAGAVTLDITRAMTDSSARPGFFRTRLEADLGVQLAALGGLVVIEDGAAASFFP